MTEGGPASLVVLDDDGFGECHITGSTDIPEGLTELSIENIEDIVYDVEGNDGFSFGGDEDHYASFEETDFSGLETI